MKYINDLAYLSHIKQTEQLVKDKKQRNKYRQTELFKGSDNTDENNNDENNTDSDNTNDTNINSSNVDGNTKSFKDAYNSPPEKVKEYERREGNDRRKSNQDRGRYVESRQRKNRRHQRELRITI